MTPDRRPDPESFLPLKPVEVLILTMLSARDRHGYGLRQDIRDHTNGQVVLEAGNLYRHVHGLEADGLVVEVLAPRSDTDERRIYYRLSPLGQRVLAAELQRLRTLVRLGEDRGIIARGRA